MDVLIGKETPEARILRVKVRQIKESDFKKWKDQAFTMRDDILTVSLLLNNMLNEKLFPEPKVNPLFVRNGKR